MLTFCRRDGATPSGIHGHQPTSRPKTVVVAWAQVGAGRADLLAPAIEVKRVPYHVRAEPKTSVMKYAVELDLTEIEVVERVQQPFEAGRPILVGGKPFRVEEIEEIRISHTELPSSEVLPKIRAMMDESRRSGNIAVVVLPDARPMRRFKEQLRDPLRLLLLLQGEKGMRVDGVLGGMPNGNTIGRGPARHARSATDTRLFDWEARLR